ncbi:energy-coupling factor transporter transmembrane component T [Heyndrickxia sporothermodurans]
MRAFETYHPIVLFTYFFAVIGLSIFFMHPIYLLITLIVSITLNIILNKRSFKNSLLFYIPLFIIVSLCNPFFSHDGMKVLFYVNYNPITLEAILYGVAMATMLLSVVFWFGSYNSVMTSDKFLYLFGKMSPAIALILSLTLRLVPRFKKQIKIIAHSQKTIGMDYTSGTILHRIKSCLQILSILITWALENSIETADSMKARGYGLKNRSAFSLFIFTKRDGIVLVMIISLAVINLIGSTFGYSTYYFYPTFSEMALTNISILLYSSYALLLAIPIIIETRESIKWHSLRSKI